MLHIDYYVFMDNYEQNKLLIQLLIDGRIQSLNEESSKLSLPYVLSSKDFQNAIYSARDNLNFNGLHIIENNDILEEAVKLTRINNPSITDEQARKLFFETLDGIFEKTKLPKSWELFVAGYVVSGLPLTAPLSSNEAIKVVDAKDSFIDIRLYKGLRYEEYLAAWQPLSHHLGKATRKNKAPVSGKRERDLQIYRKRLLGYKVSTLAKEYFGEANETNNDAVKKVINRQRNLFKKGIDLTK